MSAVAQVYFEVVGEIHDLRELASGHGVQERRQLRLRHGGVRWRKLAGTALVRLPNDRLLWAELHWYEAHGVGRVKIKIKRLLDEP